MRERGVRAKRPGRSVRAVRARSVALIVAMLAVSITSACGDGGLLATDPIRATTGDGGVTALGDALVGTWRRIIFFIDDAGVPRSSETTWRFDASGTTARSVVARDLSSGLSDAVVITGSWHVENAEVVVTFDPPAGGQVRFSASVAGDTLFLASQPYMRVR